MVVKGFCGSDPYSGDIYNTLGGGGIPAYIISGNKISISNYTEATVRDAIGDEVKNFFATQVVGNIAFERKIQGSSVTLNTTVKMFKDVTAGQIYAGVHIVENKVQHTMYGNAVVDDRFQRSAAGAKTSVKNGYLWIDRIFSGAVTAGTIKDHSFSISLDPKWKAADIEYVVCLWLINGTSVTTLSCEDAPSATSEVHNDIAQKSPSTMPYFLGNNNGTVTIAFTQTGAGDVSVLLYMASGKRVITNYYPGNVSELLIPLTGIPEGVYIFSIRQGMHAYARKIIIQGKN